MAPVPVCCFTGAPADGATAVAPRSRARLACDIAPLAEGRLAGLELGELSLAGLALAKDVGASAAPVSERSVAETTSRRVFFNVRPL
jgi:hypothetical protein